MTCILNRTVWIQLYILIITVYRTRAIENSTVATNFTSVRQVNISYIRDTSTSETEPFTLTTRGQAPEEDQEIIIVGPGPVTYDTANQTCLQAGHSFLYQDLNKTKSAINEILNGVRTGAGIWLKTDRDLQAAGTCRVWRTPLTLLNTSCHTRQMTVCFKQIASGQVLLAMTSHRVTYADAVHLCKVPGFRLISSVQDMRIQQFLEGSRSTAFWHQRLKVTPTTAAPTTTARPAGEVDLRMCITYGACHEYDKASCTSDQAGYICARKGCYKCSGQCVQGTCLNVTREIVTWRQALDICDPPRDMLRDVTRSPTEGAIRRKLGISDPCRPPRVYWVVKREYIWEPKEKCSTYGTCLGSDAILCSAKNHGFVCLKQGRCPQGVCITAYNVTDVTWAQALERCFPLEWKKRFQQFYPAVSVLRKVSPQCGQSRDVYWVVSTKGEEEEGNTESCSVIRTDGLIETTVCNDKASFFCQAGDIQGSVTEGAKVTLNSRLTETMKRIPPATIDESTNTNSKMTTSIKVTTFILIKPPEDDFFRRVVMIMLPLIAGLIGFFLIAGIVIFLCLYFKRKRRSEAKSDKGKENEEGQQTSEAKDTEMETRVAVGTDSAPTNSEMKRDQVRQGHRALYRSARYSQNIQSRKSSRPKSTRLWNILNF